MLRRLIKSPIVHFALLGLVLFTGDHWLCPGEQTASVPDNHILISRAQVAALVGRYEATTGRTVTADARTELIRRFTEEEMLFREAHRWGLARDNEAIDLRLRQIMAFVSDEEHSDHELEQQARALGLDSKDAVVRSMLIHNMRLLLSTKGEREPTDEELDAYYEREQPRFEQSARTTGWHVFFSKALRQSSVMAAASAAKAELEAAALEPEDAIALGDVFPSGSQFNGKLAHQLASSFGQEFAKTAERCPEGQWSDPIETPFGAHLLLVQRRSEPRAPPLSEIRGRVAAVYKSSRRQQRLVAAMEELADRYEVVVE